MKNKMAVTTVLIQVALIVAINIHFSCGTIIVISAKTNETVFSAEENSLIYSGSATQLRGNLIIADPVDACTDVKPPPTKNHTIVVATITGQRLQRRDTWILWATYNATEDPCSLSRKAKEAEFAGYSAIVITVYGTNDTSSVLPSFMGFDWMGVRIYTSLLKENMGNALKNFSYPNKYYLEFVNEPYFQLGLLANFIFLGCMGIVIVVVLLRLFHCLYTRVNSTVQERRRKRKAFLTEAQLRKLPVLHWRTSIPQDVCSICIENFEVGEEIRVLPCSHVFHKVCIDPWLINSSRRCPNCKGKVIFPNENLSDSSNSDSDSHLDSDDDGNERTPLLRGHDSDDEEMEDTRFIEVIPDSHIFSQNGQGRSTGSRNEGSSSRFNSSLLTDRKNPVETTDSTCLIDISSDSEQISDDSFGSFQSAHTTNNEGNGKETKLIDVDENTSVGSVKSFDSDKTFIGDKAGTSNPSASSKHISKTGDKQTFGSNASFFSCLETELERSTNSSDNNELFKSFSS